MNDNGYMKRVILIIVIVVLVLISFFYLNFTGEVVKDYSCTDSDGGINYEARGVLRIAGEEKGIDSCEQSRVDSKTNNRLKEWFCIEESNTGGSSRFHECEFKCEDGRCVEENSVDNVEEKIEVVEIAEVEEVSDELPSLSFLDRVLGGFKELF
jgi:hypothetical protein